MRIESNVTETILTTFFSKFALEKALMLGCKTVYIANWPFGGGDMSIASKSLQKRIQIVFRKTEKLDIV